MFLSRKRIRRLLDTVNQTQRVKKKRKRGLKNVNRTLRHKKPLNLRKRTLRHRKKKYKGGAGSGDNEDKGNNEAKGNNVTKIATAIKMKEEKETREVKEDRLKKEEELGPSEVFKYEIKAAGNKKLDEQIGKLKDHLAEISSASEEAKQRLTIITAVMKNLIDTKRDKERDKSGKMDVDSEIKRMSGLKSDLTKIISKYEIIKQTYTNDVKNITEYKEKKVFYEYTEPKSRISFYAATLEDFAKPYDKREGVNLIFPVYASEPFFIDTEYIGDAMVKKIKDGFKYKEGIIFKKVTNLDSDMINMINDYNTKSPGQLVVEDKKLDAALDADADNNQTSNTAQGVGSEQAVKDDYAGKVVKEGLVNEDTTEAMAAAKDEKANREAVDEALDAGRETAPPITGGQRGGASPASPKNSEATMT